MAKHTRRQAHIDPDAFRTDVAHALHAAIERARELEIAGPTIRDAVLEAAFDDPGDELRSRAARLQGGARYALTLLSEIETLLGGSTASASRASCSSTGSTTRSSSAPQARDAESAVRGRRDGAASRF